jgi:predicted dehydrogenase
MATAAGMAGSGAGIAAGAGGAVALVGCGFVADLYMASARVHPEVRVLGAWDRDPARLRAFCDHWGVAPALSLDTLIAALPRDGLLLNLTNPASHAEVTRAALEAGRHVWSEKPMALSLAQARELMGLAQARGLHLASAPSSVLSEASQALGLALRQGRGGTPRLIYAELDDGFLAQAPVAAWRGESGAPWPVADELRTGCALEHAGYWLGWLVAHLGPVREVTTATALAVPGKHRDLAGATEEGPDLAVATLLFAAGPVARLTCSIVAPHDHRLRVVGDGGVLEVGAAWDNAAPVRLRGRVRVRRRLIDLPVGRRVRLKGPTHPKVGRTGAASMNFMLGPAEALGAIRAGRAPRLSGDYALHLTEATLACATAGHHVMATTCQPLEPMPWAR